MLKDGLATFHTFKTSTLPRDENFAPTARQSHGRKANLEMNICMAEVLNWHYKHTVIMSWGGTSLISFMRDFPTADADMVARSNDQEMEFATSPASSADFPWDFDC